MERRRRRQIHNAGGENQQAQYVTFYAGFLSQARHELLQLRPQAPVFLAMMWVRLWSGADTQ
jgi:hypothetical protein